MRPLREKLLSLQCHFTWNFGIKDKVNAAHILQKLALQAEHTPYHNRGTLIAMRAYLLQVQGSYQEALESLEEAEEALKQDHPTSFSCQVLAAYGNYAWIYYHLTNYDMVELYLAKIHEICQTLSSPEPYSVLIPEIHAQKGWFLLAMGFRNGEEATECFRMALEGDASKAEYHAGLAISVFASWRTTWRDDLKREAKDLMEEIILSQPQSYEIKVYLASLLPRRAWQRVNHLVEGVVQNSFNPEVLRTAAQLCQSQSLSQAITILKQAIALDPNYHLLHYDLGICYKNQMEGASPEGRAEMLAAATESFKRAVEMDPLFIYPTLELAKAYGETSPAYEEEIFQNLMEELPSTSERCQQAIYLHWGDFLLHRKGLKHEALEMYKAGLAISDLQNRERRQLKDRLMNLVKMFQEDPETKATYSVAPLSYGENLDICFRRRIIE
ncbi:interferon-induced protein with tetratricopeptide repeats 5-like [Elgaria multicarinata webbii]|uniref:interferon-induced protein with tetratricopeptide repeats 5-like n=1 Tax=Elgaria multicarinata webbii TaxID=159646 RepID=UPI002FCCB8BB